MPSYNPVNEDTIQPSTNTRIVSAPSLDWVSWWPWYGPEEEDDFDEWMIRVDWKVQS